MAWGYLISVLLAVAMVAVVVLAPARPRPLAKASHFFAPLVNEAPLWLLGALVGSTALLIGQGDAQRPGSVPAMLLAALVVATLIRVMVRGARAREVVGQRIARIPGRTRAQLLGQFVWPWPVRPRGLERIRNLSYGPHGRRQRLDVHRRRGGGRQMPILVHFHAGGFFSGDKGRQSLPLLYRKAADGWLCVSATYRLRPTAGYAEHLADAQAVLDWLRDRGPALGGDPELICVAGSSAGAHLAVACALRNAAGGAHPRVTAVIGLYGYYGYYYGMGPGDLPLSSPAALPVPPEVCPFLIVHGTDDTYVPLANAQKLVQHLREGRARVTALTLPAAQHSFDLFDSPRYAAVVAGSSQFLEQARHGARPDHA